MKYFTYQRIYFFYCRIWNLHSNHPICNDEKQSKNTYLLLTFHHIFINKYLPLQSALSSITVWKLFCIITQKITTVTCFIMMQSIIKTINLWHTLQILENIMTWYTNVSKIHVFIVSLKKTWSLKWRGKRY